MIDVLADEWFALRTLRWVRGVGLGSAVATLVGSAGMAYLLSRAPDATLDGDGILALLLRTNVALPGTAALLGAGLSAGDVRTGAVLPAILRARGRERLWLARTVLAALVGLGLAVVTLAVAVASVAVVVGPVSAEALMAVAPGTAAIGAGWAVAAAGAGAVLHRPAAAAALPVVVAYVVEPVLRAVLASGPASLQGLAAHLPFGAATSLVRAPDRAGELFEHAASWPVSAAVYLATVTGVALVGRATFLRRDLAPAVAA